ncbi:zinc finger protein [Musa troglodytarum]|uniref:Protein EARLY HEADING DATE 2 n=1 Tax=Musa troglodytarum TaxID=320322 RepID=A0A9E7JN51_9LILI|nr:zinc finger protein [Musa troglodytarum]
MCVADPDSEVIALSPKTLLATNRFICEVCNKGFQREQNLQLHRRGHNLPWKLRLKSNKEVRRRVYLCPEPTCVHHDPSRALGDLTGIKKHFCRKHGEKKWKCDKCSKRYAVQSDLKAHSKTCGTREYRCDCGTLFSRRDSFITHRAFCNALAQERSRLPTAGLNNLSSHLESTTLFNGDLMGDHVGGEMNSLYNTSMQNESILPRMSATALLQKAAQMGLTTCGGSSLSRGFGSSTSGSLKPPSLGGGGGGNGGDGLQAQMENEAHLQNLMNSLANGSSRTIGGLGSFAAGLRDVDETKFSLSSTGSLGVSDRLTRDFLGVGGMARNISGGMSRREQNHGIGMNALDPK